MHRCAFLTVVFSFFLLLSLLSFTDAGFEEMGEPPENEDLMLDSWVRGFWEAVPHKGLLSGTLQVSPMSPRQHEGLLEEGVDFLLNPRIRFEAASSAAFKSWSDEEIPYYLLETSFGHRDHIVFQVLGIRPRCGGGPLALGYAAQQFRSFELVKKAAENIEGEWASTRFLVARFLNDLRLLNLMLRQEQDPRVLMMLCIKASGHIAARGDGYELLRKLVVDTIPSIQDTILLRTLAMFCEEDEKILMRLFSSSDAATSRIASWRLRNIEIR